MKLFTGLLSRFRGDSEGKPAVAEVKSKGKKCLSVKMHLTLLVVIALSSTGITLNAFASLAMARDKDAANIAESEWSASYIEDAIAEKMAENGEVATSLAEYLHNSGTNSFSQALKSQRLNEEDTVCYLFNSNFTPVHRMGIQPSDSEIKDKGYPQEAFSGGSDDFLEVINDELFAVSYRPVKYPQDQLNYALVLLTRIDSNSFVDEMKEITDYEVTIFLGNKRVATTIMDKDTNTRVIGTTMDDDIAKIVLTDGQVYTGKHKLQGEQCAVEYRPIRDRNNDIIGALFSGISLTSTHQSVLKFSSFMLLMLCISLTTGILVSLTRLKQLVFKPMDRTVQYIAEVAKGNLGLQTELDNTYAYRTGDEFGTLFAEVDHMVSAVGILIKDIDSVLSHLAMGDLTAKPAAEYIGDYASIKSSINGTLVELNEALSSVQNSAIQLTSSADCLASGAQELAQGSTEQSSAVEELNATVEAVNTEVQSNAEATGETAEEAEKVGQSVAAIQESTAQLIEAIHQINESFGKVMAIVKTVQDIAFQTKILSLNAAIEAARAGEAGKGFTVVANEVGTLATNSDNAARSIEKLIKEASIAVESGTAVANSTVQEMTGISADINKIVSSVHEVNEGTQRQAKSIGEIKKGMEQISQVVCSTSATSEETAATAEELSSQSNILNDLCAKFKLS